MRLLVQRFNISQANLEGESMLLKNARSRDNQRHERHHRQGKTKPRWDVNFIHGQVRLTFTCPSTN